MFEVLKNQINTKISKKQSSKIKRIGLTKNARIADDADTQAWIEIFH